MTVSDASLDESGSNLSKIAATSLLLGVTRTLSEAYEKIQKLSTTEDMFQLEYGPKGTARREEFEAKARAWYYAEVLRDARKAAGMN